MPIIASASLFAPGNFDLWTLKETKKGIKRVYGAARPVDGLSLNLLERPGGVSSQLPTVDEVMSHGCGDEVVVLF
jgi:hypothetical protein